MSRGSERRQVRARLVAEAQAAVRARIPEDTGDGKRRPWDADTVLGCALLAAGLVLALVALRVL